MFRHKKRFLNGAFLPNLASPNARFSRVIFKNASNEAYNWWSLEIRTILQRDFFPYHGTQEKGCDIVLNLIQNAIDLQDITAIIRNERELSNNT